jgi:DNA-binding PadR family transcriptional regulator
MTELDATILAIISHQGPLSAYDIRKVFAQSLTPAWSSSPGAVYPSVRRLAAVGLVTQTDPHGARSRQHLTITQRGRKALAAWLTNLDPEIAAPTPDPIRTRLYFLELLGPGQRRQLIADAIQHTSAAIANAQERLKKRAQEGVDKLQLFAAEGVLYELKARRRWLESVATRISN